MAYIKMVGRYHIVGHPNHYAVITSPDYTAWTQGNNRVTQQDFKTVEEAEEFIFNHMQKRD